MYFDSTIFINTMKFFFPMGRIKTTLVKRTTEELLAKHSGEFSADFDKNKAKVSMFVPVPSKKLRNIIAGYITRNKRRENSNPAA